MKPRVLLSALVRALPLVGPFLRRVDILEAIAVIHDARLKRLDQIRDLAAAEVRGRVGDDFVARVAHLAGAIVPCGECGQPSAFSERAPTRCNACNRTRGAAA